MRQTKTRMFIKDTQPYTLMLRLSLRHGIATAVTGGLVLQARFPGLETRAAYKRANYMLKRLEALKYMKRQRIEGVDCFAVTTPGCRWLEAQEGSPEGTYKTKVDTLRPTKAGNLRCKHRLLSDVALLGICREIASETRETRLFWRTERECLFPNVSENLQRVFGKKPDGFIRAENCGSHVAIEVERTRRKPEGAFDLLGAMRRCSSIGDPRDDHPALWWFITTRECRTDLVRFITNEFGQRDFKHIEVDGQDFIQFSTAAYGDTSLHKYPSTARGAGFALISTIDFEQVMDWTETLFESSPSTRTILTAALQGDIDIAADSLINNAQYEEKGSRIITAR